MASRTTAKPKPYRVALIGGDTLLGREIEDVLKERTPGALMTPFAATAEGSFTTQEDETVYIKPLSPETIKEQDAIILAGSGDGAQKAQALAAESKHPPVLIDCTGYLEQQPKAQLVLPMLGETDTGATRLFVLAHPAAAAATTVLVRLARKAHIRQTIIHVFEPASELGKRGINELHQQTTSLLAFKPLEKKVFDTQLSFNMLAQYGEEAVRKLAGSEQRIIRHTASLLDKYGHAAIPMPSVRLVQAPVFHGYSLSIWVELETAMTATTIAETLASAQIDVRGEGEEAPTSIGAIGQSGIMAGDIRIDENNPKAAWIWVVGDNLRLLADGVADLLAEIRKPVQ